MAMSRFVQDMPYNVLPGDNPVEFIRTLNERLRNINDIGSRLATAANLDKATWGILQPLTVTDDVVKNRYIVKWPEEGDGPAEFVDLSVVAYSPPIGSAARLEIERSTDKGATWNNILLSPGYIELADGVATRQDYEDIFATGIAFNDLMRLNCTQIGSSFAGQYIEVKLRWR
jgi:hypothetical protein